MKRNRFERCLLLGLGLLLGAAACEAPPLEQEPESERAGSAELAELEQALGSFSQESFSREDGEQQRCVCISFPCTTCEVGSLFCNDQGDCFCDPSVALESTARSVAPRNRCVDRNLAADVGAIATLARAPHGSSDEDELRRQEPGCSCAGGSASSVAADCPEENWYCNLSGVCRCHW
ncbi:MAG TPA: hypothetical protein VFS67_10095 [Polyangiaceae bacterium]|jgi:hypothetical protein|nr:hypothetical protein [Polyangiaceae bacterium]